MKKIIVFCLVLILLSSLGLAYIDFENQEVDVDSLSELPSSLVSNGVLKIRVTLVGPETTGTLVVLDEDGNELYRDELTLTQEGEEGELEYTFLGDGLYIVAIKLSTDSPFDIYSYRREVVAADGEEPAGVPPLGDIGDDLKRGPPIPLGDEGVFDPSDIPGDLEEGTYYPIGDAGYGIVVVDGTYYIVAEDEEGRLVIVSRDDKTGRLVIDWDAWDKEFGPKKTLWVRFVDWLKDLLGIGDITGHFCVTATWEDQSTSKCTTFTDIEVYNQIVNRMDYLSDNYPPEAGDDATFCMTVSWGEKKSESTCLLPCAVSGDIFLGEGEEEVPVIPLGGNLKHLADIIDAILSILTNGGVC